DESGGELAKVVDFGISKALRDLNQRVTKTGFVSGTYEFMSPEQIMAGAPDHRTDVYALGLIAFLMLTGTLPFAGETAEHSMLLRLSQTPRTLREALPNLQWPDDLQAAVDGALARDPAERYSSAATFARSLGDAIERWQRIPAESGRLAGRRRSWIGAGGAVAALGLGVALYFGVVGREETEVPTPLASVSDTSEAVEMGDLGPPPGDTVIRVTIDSAPEQREAPPPPPSRTPVNRSSSDRPNQPPSKPDNRLSRLTPPEAAALLGTYGSALLSEPPEDSVRLVIRSLNLLLQRLGTKRDSVQAAIYLAEAHALIGLEERACAILDTARREATRIQRERIELWDSEGVCKFTRWTRS
ncbi:MAG: serine/threonine protein kinase, partial [Gemmatimonadales bacterium]